MLLVLTSLCKPKAVVCSPSHEDREAEVPPWDPSSVGACTEPLEAGNIPPCSQQH